MYNKELLKRIYPFKSNHIDIDGMQYHYVDEGPRDDSAIIMVHGNPTWSFYYRELITALKGKYRVIAPDHIGCGLSDKPQDYEYTLANHISNLQTLVKRLGLKRVTLVLHDWGGAIGMGVAVKNPELIEKFVIFNTAAFLVDRIPFRIGVFRLPLIGDIGIRGLNMFAYPATSMACKQRSKMTEDVKAGLLLPYNNYANRIANLRFVQDIPLSENDKSYKVVKSIEERLGLFKNHPMLILWGAKDFCFNNVFLERWKEYFPGARVKVFDYAGHYVVLDANDEIIPIIESWFASKK